MYAEFFGLKQAPFSIAPDPRYLYMSERHREALAHLLYGLGGGGGFVLLTGEIGAGKTTVCRCFLEQIPAHCNVAYIFNPKLTVIELVKSVCDEFGVSYPAREPGTATVTDYLNPLNAFLLTSHAAGRNNVLIIDEAQNLSADVLEQLRLMTNLETSERKLLQIVLIGQPELREKLAQPGLQQLAQRVIARFHLEALSEAETAQYIRHRLAVAGLTGPLPLAAASLRLIHRLCGGVPRRINLLCDRALLGAYASHQSVVDRRVIERAAREVFGEAADGVGQPSRRRMASGLTLAAVLLLGAGAYSAVAWWAQHGGGKRLPAEAVASAVAPAQAASASAPNAPASAAEEPASAASVATTAVSAPSAASASAANDADGAAPPASVATAVDFDARIAFERWPRQEHEAWRQLAQRWGVQFDGADRDPCVSGALQPLSCSRMTTTLSVLRQLDRPGLLTLRQGSGKPAYAVLSAVEGDAAIVQAGTRAMRLPLGTLAALWNGEFATLWRAPADYRAPLTLGATGAGVDGLAARLAAWSGEPPPTPGRSFDASLKARLAAFQRVQGLSPDGVAGPTTFMQLNRVAGVDEPRLSSHRPQR